jgi:hypothetical protein
VRAVTAPHGDNGAGDDRVKCPTCNRPFRDAAALSRHRERTVPCAGTSKTRPGEPCDTCLTPPKTVCRFHGGKAPQVQAAVERRRQEQRAARNVAAFALPADVEPSVALLDSLYRWYGMATYLAGVIAEFETDDALKQLSVGSERYERPSVWVELYREAVKEQAKVAKACLDAGIDERRMRFTERQGQALDAVIRAVIAGILTWAASAGMNQAELQRFEQEELPRIVRAAVMKLLPPDELNGGSDK